MPDICDFSSMTTNYLKRAKMTESYTVIRAMPEPQEKPDWKDAPEWANYLAFCHTDNGWYWFEYRPEASYTGWTLNPAFPVGRTRRHGDPEDWQDTLECKYDKEE